MATAPIRPLARGPPYAAGAALEKRIFFPLKKDAAAAPKSGILARERSWISRELNLSRKDHGGGRKWGQSREWGGGKTRGGGGQDGVMSSLESQAPLLPRPMSFFPVSGPTHWSPAAAPLTDHMCLNVSVTEVIKSSNLAGRSFSVSTG